MSFEAQYFARSSSKHMFVDVVPDFRRQLREERTLLLFALSIDAWLSW
jgi:hypothetical protein